MGIMNSKSRILVVDDEPTNLSLLYNVLSEEFDLYLLSDGKSAIDLLKEKEVNLILLDVIMPELDGYDTARLIKSNPKTSKIPIIFMSALGDISNKIKGFESGAVDFITKPFQKEEVIIRIKTHLTLRRYQKELEKINADKNTLFSALSHDLRSPFMALIGFGEILKTDYRTLTKNEVKEIGDKIFKTSTNTFNLLENLLNWARIQQNDIKPFIEEINLFEIISDCIFQFAELYKSKRINVTNFIQKDLTCYADRTMLSVIIRNCFSNSIKFTETNGEIQFSYSCIGNICKLLISDTGKGISSEKLERIFDLYSNKSTQGTKNETGTGIGLHLCKQLADKMNINFIIESEEGVGTVAIIEVPQTAFND